MQATTTGNLPPACHPGSSMAAESQLDVPISAAQLARQGLDEFAAGKHARAAHTLSSALECCSVGEQPALLCNRAACYLGEAPVTAPGAGPCHFCHFPCVFQPCACIESALRIVSLA